MLTVGCKPETEKPEMHRCSALVVWLMHSGAGKEYTSNGCKGDLLVLQTKNISTAFYPGAADEMKHRHTDAIVEPVNNNIFTAGQQELLAPIPLQGCLPPRYSLAHIKGSQSDYIMPANH